MGWESLWGEEVRSSGTVSSARRESLAEKKMQIASDAVGPRLVEVPGSRSFSPTADV
jgi:hypothetical protein